jgi:DNA-binding transcriptional regulator YhcF (GntR family)
VHRGRLVYVNILMHLTLSRTSPTPLNHQIFQAIRWRIGTGDLRAGDQLLVIQEAAALWAVNYHTGAVARSDRGHG